METSQNYAQPIPIKKVVDYSEQEMIESLFRDIGYKQKEIAYIQKNLIAEYIKLMRSVSLIVWYLLTTKYMYTYLRKLLERYFFLLLKIMLYMSLLFLLMVLLGRLGFDIYPFSIITDYCYDTFIEWYFYI